MQDTALKLINLAISPAFMGGGNYQRLSDKNAVAWLQETLDELGDRVRGQPDPILIPTQPDPQKFLDSFENEWDEYIRPVLEQSGYTSNEQSDLLCMAYEALLNAAEHGNSWESGTMVRLHTYIRKDGVLLAVTDEGNGLEQDDIGAYTEINDHGTEITRGSGFEHWFSQAAGRSRGSHGFTLYLPWRNS